MTYNNKAKLKTLYVRQILEEETDAERGLSMRQIIERLEQHEIKAERKSVYRDIEVLREFGCDICSYQRNPVEYALIRRQFKLPELMLMVDAVQSNKALTVRQSTALETNTPMLVPDNPFLATTAPILVCDSSTTRNQSSLPSPFSFSTSSHV